MTSLNKNYVYLINLLSGLVLGLCVLFSQYLFFAFLALICIAPIFYVNQFLKGFWQHYTAGLFFLSAYLIPNSLWFFYFMPPWLGVLCLTFPSLFANVFTLPTLFKKKNFWFTSLALILVWVLFIAIRVNTPIIDFWWFPHLGYTQWKNTMVVQLARWGGIYPIIAFVLLFNAFLAFLLNKRKFTWLVLSVVIVFIVCSTGNALLNFDTNYKPKFNLIAIQTTHDNTQKLLAEKDYNKLERMTENALEKVGRKDLPTFVVWPEAEIHTDTLLHPNLYNRLKRFVQKNNIYLSCVLYRHSGEERPNEASTIIAPDGITISENFKKHTTSSEYSIPKDFFKKANLQGINIGSADCFDFHYPDIMEKMNQTELFFGNIDDGKHGKWLPYYHTADILYHSVQTGNSVLTASFNGPTFFARENGSIVQMLPLEKDGYIITTYNK